MKEITTSKGVFIVCDKSKLSWSDRFYINYRIKENCQVLKLTEQQASEIVDETIMYEKHKIKCYRYRSYIGGFVAFDNSIDSLHSLIKSHNIEINENTYIFKVK